MIANIFTLLQSCIVTLIALAAVELLQGVTFSLLLIVNLIWFANPNTFLDGFIVFLIIFARHALWHVCIKMSVFGTRFALICQLIPHWSQLGTRFTSAGLSVNNRLISWTGLTKFIDRVPSRFVFRTHTDTRTRLIARFDWDETDTLVCGLVELVTGLASADSFSERKDWSLGTSKASVVKFVGKGCLNGTGGHVEFGGLGKYHKSVLLLGDIAVNPVWRL